MHYFRNYELAKIYQVSQATVGKWVTAAKKDKLDLKLETYEGRAYIANTAKNILTMENLVEDRKKYRNSRALKITTSSISRLAGIWKSNYTYRNSNYGKDVAAVHYLRLYPKGNGLIVETLSSANESYMLARFSLDGNIATGGWQESTSLKGDYKGVTYHGAGQLIIADDGKSMRGKWVGFGKNMEVKTGPWEFTYLGADESVLDKVGIAPGQ